MSKARPVTIELAIDALQRAGPGWHLTCDLPLVRSVRALGAALRHARRQGAVESQLYGGNTMKWRLKR